MSLLLAVEAPRDTTGTDNTGIGQSFKVLLVRGSHSNGHATRLDSTGLEERRQDAVSLVGLGPQVD